MNIRNTFLAILLLAGTFKLPGCDIQFRLPTTEPSSKSYREWQARDRQYREMIDEVNRQFAESRQQYEDYLKQWENPQEFQTQQENEQ